MTGRTKTTWISGAGGGIGGATALMLARRGDRIALLCRRSLSAAAKVEEHIRREGGQARVFSADLTSRQSVQEICLEIRTTFGPADVLVNCAGLAHCAQFQDIGEEAWDQLMDANLKSAYLLSQAVLPDMLASKAGAIVNIASMWGQVGASCEVHYSAAKGGLIALTKALAKELGPSGIRVNAVAPGAIDTAMLADLDEAARRQLVDMTPLGRLGSTEDVASAVAFLTGEGASFITGQVLGVNGGLVI